MADPVFNDFYYLPGPPLVEGAGGPTVDAGDPTPAEGIVIALVNDTLEMAQTWERLD